MEKAKIRIVFIFAFSIISSLKAYNIDSLFQSISTYHIDQKHTIIIDEIVTLQSSSPQDAIKIGKKWLIDLSKAKEPNKEAEVWDLLSQCYYRISDFNNSILCSQKAISLFNDVTHIKGSTKAKVQLALVYAKMNEYEDAYKLYNESIEILKKIGDNSELAACYNHLGNLLEKWKDDKKTAYSCYKQSIFYAEKDTNIESISYSLEFIGMIKSSNNELDSALLYMKRSLDFRKKLNNKFAMALSYTNIGELYQTQKKLEAAKINFRKALELSVLIDYNDLSRYLYENLGNIAKEQGDYETAFMYMYKQDSIQDQIYNEEKLKEFAVTKEELSNQLNEKKIEILNKEKEITNKQNRIKIIVISVIGGVIIFILIVVFLVISILKQRTRNREKLNEEKLRSQLIQEAEEEERRRISKDLHDSLGQMLAALKINFQHIKTENEDQLSKTKSLLDDTIKEMRNISHSMMPETLVKFGLDKALVDLASRTSTPSTKVVVIADNWNDWNKTNEYVLFRVIQELINNSLKHANCSEIRIELNRFDDEINLLYEDNGIGFNMSNASDGIGLQNMKLRIQSIQGQMEMNSTLGKGTSAVIYIPINTKEI